MTSGEAARKIRQGCWIRPAVYLQTPERPVIDRLPSPGLGTRAKTTLGAELMRGSPSCHGPRSLSHDLPTPISAAGGEPNTGRVEKIGGGDHPPQPPRPHPPHNRAA